MNHNEFIHALKNIPLSVEEYKSYGLSETISQHFSNSNLSIIKREKNLTLVKNTNDPIVLLVQENKLMDISIGCVVFL